VRWIHQRDQFSGVVFDIAGTVGLDDVSMDLILAAAYSGGFEGQRGDWVGWVLVVQVDRVNVSRYVW